METTIMGYIGKSCASLNCKPMSELGAEERSLSRNPRPAKPVGIW